MQVKEPLTVTTRSLFFNSNDSFLRKVLEREKTLPLYGTEVSVIVDLIECAPMTSKPAAESPFSAPVQDATRRARRTKRYLSYPIHRLSS
jgi:hypothetical protein